MSRLFLPCMCLVFLLSPGCAAVVAGAAGAGTVKYLANGSERNYAADVQTTWTATLASLRDIGYPVDPATGVPSNGALDVGDAKIRVRPANDGDGGSIVWARFGTFDNRKNREKTHRLLDGVGARLAPAEAS